MVRCKGIQISSAEDLYVLIMPMLQALNSPKVESKSRSPLVYSTASAPGNIAGGFNEFLRSLDVTIRRDPANFRLRINKKGSSRDRDQI